MKTRNRHHRLCKSHGGKLDYPKGNMVTVCAIKHREFHAFFGTMNVHEIARMLTDQWIDPRYRLVVELKPKGEM